MKLARWMGIVILLPAIAGAQTPAAGQGSSRPLPRQERDAIPPGAAEPLPVFEFHSGFWVNLHHFLYQMARNVTPASETSGPAPAAWTGALDYYSRTLANRDLLFNGDMVAIKNRLAEMESEANLQRSGLKPDLVAALEKAAPIYRARWWTEHDRRNREWIAAVSPLIRRLGRPLALRLAAIYREKWPLERIRVDVAVEAGTYGAYTTLEPTHVMVSSAEEKNQGAAALEILFHEASHSLAAGVREAIARECRVRGKPIPRELWHALVFYTTGEVVQQTLGSEAGTLKTKGTEGEGAGSEHYTPYALRNRLYDRPPWRGQNYLQLLERHWRPYLDGTQDFDRSITHLVNAL